MTDNTFACRAKKIVTVSKYKTIEDGVIIISNGKIKSIGTYKELENQLNNITIYDYSDKIITPSLIDCHCHLLEYAAGSLYPVTKETYLNAGKSLILNALLYGITAIGEQLCGSPICDIPIDEYMDVAKDSPVRIKFSLNSITIGTDKLVHYNCLSGNKEVGKDILTDSENLSILAEKNEFPGENIFINATPANLHLSLVPRAGNIVFNEDELKIIVNAYHEKGKRIGAHVGGNEGIDLAIKCGVDVIHHGHGISDEQIKKVRDNNISIVATPLGGTHLVPNLPNDILKLVSNGIDVSIATDAYLPQKVRDNNISIVATPLGGTHLVPNLPNDILKLVSNGIDVSIATDAYLPPASHLDLDANKLYGSDVLMLIARPAMELLFDNGFDENVCLSLLTSNPARILGLDDVVGKLDVGMDADFLVSNGVPGLEVWESDDILSVFVNGKMMISR